MLAERIMIEDLDTAFTQWTQELIGATFERQLMDLAPVIYREFDSHFKNAQGPNGAWQKRTRQYPWPILVKTGKLSYAATVANGQGNITRFRDGWAEFGLDVGVVNYAAFHEYGTSRMAARPWCWVSSATVDEAAKLLLDSLYTEHVG